jgi:triacylglycerol lipase
MTKFAKHFTGVKPKKSYDPEISLSLAVACDLAYRTKDVILKQAAKWKYGNVTFIDVKKGRDIDTQGYVMSNDTDIICVFRGSESIEDWFSNFQAVHDPGPLNGTLAHEGFQDALFPAVIALTNAIDSMNRNSKRIWVTGHSLGGALCSLYAGMMIENNYDIYGIYTFASPRPADDTFATALNNAMRSRAHYRVVNEGDIVPHVPPEPFFSHPGGRIILEKSKIKRSKSDWTKLRKRMFDVLMKMTGKLMNLKDIGDNHRLHTKDKGYIARLIRQVAN